ncbi:hypothetical protein WJ60_17510 [Burkholderia ubonensis]|uniref:fimbria/pilus chaperone family protein n=1 Tax=Burkholderia ubonensis TaxID=101571 RepID=UPI0007573D74|nr:fimbria/pilus chaperone family protein [Burkholderia ubonensis]KVM62861.1 hypothetical protein WJ60_17510 [Burkholderia ubonensis]
MMRFSLSAALLACAALSPIAHASGVLPETSVVLVDEADGEASINVQNTDTQPTLLYTTIQNVPEDPANLVTVTPPVARVEPGQSQLVRFVLTNPTPLKTERLKRVTFEGIPPANTSQSRVQITVRQNLPVILHPKGLKVENAPWTGLKWSLQDGALRVTNPSPYVVRLSQQVALLPSQTPLLLPHPYILPGEQLKATPAPKRPDASGTSTTSPAAPLPAHASGVRLYPATTYGFSVQRYDAAIAAPSAAGQ